MDLVIRPIVADEIGAMDLTMGYGFGHDNEPESLPHLLAITPLERTRCAFDGGELVGSLGAFALELTVPGATVAAAGTTMVAVRASHRRSGLLRAMMRAHIDDTHERGEPLASLWASESQIYGRFGYGLAAYMCSITIEKARTSLLDPPDSAGRLRMIQTEEASELLPRVYERVWRDRPGHFARTPPWWEHQRLYDPKWAREGASKFRYALYEEDGEARGYLQYRVKPASSGPGVADGTLIVIELQGVDARAHHALWHYAFGIDLIKTIEAFDMPADETLPWLVADSRRVRRSLADSMWIRLVDLPRALEARAYSVAGRLVLRVEDEFCPWNSGTWELEGGPDGAKCRPAQETPDLSMTARELGAIYLGGNRLQTLARAGQVHGDAAALRRADAMFTWDPLPWCPEVF